MDKRLRAKGLSPLAYQPGGIQQELVAGILAQEELQAHGAEYAEEAGEAERLYPIHAKHVDRVGVIAEHHGTAFTGPPPQALFAVRKLPIREGHAHVCVEQMGMIDRGGADWGRDVRQGIDSENGVGAEV